MTWGFSPRVLAVAGLMLLVLSHAAPALHRRESWSITPNGVVEGTGDKLSKSADFGKPQKGMKRSLIRRVNNSRSMIPLQKGLIRRERNGRKASKPALQTKPGNSEQRIKGLLQKMARERRQLQIAHNEMEQLRAASLAGEWERDKHVRKAQAAATPEAEAVTCASISPCQACIDTYPTSGADSGKICVWSPSQHACLPYEDFSGKMQFADVIHGIHGYPGGSSCAEARVPCSVFSCIGATPVNKGSSVKCGEDLASCNAATCCEANLIATTVLKAEEKVVQVFTMKGLSFTKVTQDATKKSALIDTIKAGALENLPAGYTAADLEVVLSAGSVVAEVIITPTAGSNHTELAAGLEAHGEESTSVITRVKQMPFVENLLESGKTLNDLTVTHTVKASEPKEAGVLPMTTKLLPTPAPPPPPPPKGAIDGDEAGGSKTSSSSGTSPSPSPSGSPTPSPSPVGASGEDKKGGNSLGLGIGIAIGALVFIALGSLLWWCSRHYHIRTTPRGQPLPSGVWMDASEEPESDLLPTSLDVASSDSFTIGTSDSFIIS